MPLTTHHALKRGKSSEVSKSNILATCLLVSSYAALSTAKKTRKITEESDEEDDNDNARSTTHKKKQPGESKLVIWRPYYLTQSVPSAKRQKPSHKTVLSEEEEDSDGVLKDIEVQTLKDTGEMWHDKTADIKWFYTEPLTVQGGKVKGHRKCTLCP